MGKLLRKAGGSLGVWMDIFDPEYGRRCPGNLCPICDSPSLLLHRFLSHDGGSTQC